MSGLSLMTTQLGAQIIEGTCIDSRSGETLPFAAIIEQGTFNGVYSDIDGRFEMILTDSLRAIEINLIGYQPLHFNRYTEMPRIIRLTPAENLLQEITIRPGINPAERIMQLAIERKAINNPEGNSAFTYNSYNKLIFGAAIDSTLLSDSAPSSIDSNAIEAAQFLKKQHLFLMESITERRYCPPNHTEETVIANRVSGLQNTDLFLLGTQLQSFSFYGESVDLLEVQYVSPLSKNAIRKYYFELEDTTYIGNDSVFAISFRPRAGKNFPSLRGRLYINSNGYAIQQVVAEPNQRGKMQFKIQQQYGFLESKQWFPLQLNSSIVFDSTLSVGPFPMIGEGRSYIKNIQLDAPLKVSQFTPVTLEMKPDAGRASDTLWSKYRDQPLSEKETRTYHVIDSVGKELHLDRRLKAFEALTSGQISLGYINFDAKQLLRFNNYEGLRLGGGLRTNHRLSEKFNTGGYVAYGFKDRTYKFGGDVLVHLYRKRNAWLKLEYSNDVMEMGGNGIKPTEQSMLISQNLYPLFISRMDRREKMQATLNARVIGNLTCTAFLNSQYIAAFNNYAFSRITQESVTLTDSNYRVSEAGLLLRYAPGERLARTPTREVRLGGRFPVFHFQYTTGLSNVLLGTYAYTRVDARMDKTFQMLNFGKLSISALSGFCPHNVPLSLLYNAEGTYEKFTIVAPGSFQTMRVNEFMHSRYVAFHLRHAFREFVLFHGSFKPKLVLAHSMLWGDLRYKSSHNFQSNQAEKGYMESGIQLDNLMISGFSGLGLGVYYRYGVYALPNVKDNLAVKLTTSFTF